MYTFKTVSLQIIFKFWYRYSLNNFYSNYFLPVTALCRTIETTFIYIYFYFLTNISHNYATILYSTIICATVCSRESPLFHFIHFRSKVSQNFQFYLDCLNIRFHSYSALVRLHSTLHLLYLKTFKENKHLINECLYFTDFTCTTFLHKLNFVQQWATN